MHKIVIESATFPSFTPFGRYYWSEEEKKGELVQKAFYYLYYSRTATILSNVPKLSL